MSMNMVIPFWYTFSQTSSQTMADIPQRQLLKVAKLSSAVWHTSSVRVDSPWLQHTLCYGNFLDQTRRTAKHVKSSSSEASGGSDLTAERKITDVL